MPQTVVIIGYGTAAVNALIALRSSGYEGCVRIFTDDSLEQPYSPILTSYYAGGMIEYEDAFPFADLDLASLGAEVVCETPVTGIDPARHVVITPLEEVPYDKCLIASGSHPSIAGFPLPKGRSPLCLRTMLDAELLRDSLMRPTCKRVLVSGTSMVALKATEACLAHDVEVTLLGRSEHILTRIALPEVAAEFESALADKGVKLRLSQTITNTAVADGCFEVAFSNGDVELFDEVLVAHGMTPGLEFVSEGTLACDVGLIVDEFMRTSDPDVYAAGDVAQAIELISGEKRIVGIWKNAAVQGACAGSAIAAELAGGQPDAAVAYRGSISSNTIAVNGTLFISAGTMEVTPQRQVEVQEDGEMTVVRIFEEQADGEERLVGFNIVCDADEPGGKAYDLGAMMSLRIEKACCR